jgi:hypothetical protein
MYFSTVTKMKKRFIDEDNKRIGTPHWIVSHGFRMCRGSPVLSLSNTFFKKDVLMKQ